MLGWFPSASYERLGTDIYQNIRHLVLPVMTLGFHHAGSIARMTRANLLEVLREDYVRTARSKGVSEPSVILRHAFRSAIVPTLSIIGLVIALIIGGSPVIETVFAIPGVGRLMVTSVLRRDFPMIQGVVLLIAMSMALVNFVVDLTYALADPRVTYS
jgi:peptide/nickel transport system permease protein